MRGKAVFVVLFLTQVAAAAPEAGASERCRPETADDAKLYSSDLAWNQPHADMMSRYERIYQSGKRLPKRAYWDSVNGRYFLPYFNGENPAAVPITEDFIAAVRTHIEKALQRKYADAVFFSDLGHSHALIPEQKYQAEYSGIARLTDLYTKLLADNEVRFLYHTAEQLDTEGSDPHLVWRLNTRNLVGENRPGGEVHIEAGYHEKAHTLRDVKGYYWYSAAFNLSASAGGCFPFVTPAGETQYFDLSLYDLESETPVGGFAIVAEGFGAVDGAN